MPSLCRKAARGIAALPAQGAQDRVSAHGRPLRRPVGVRAVIGHVQREEIGIANAVLLQQRPEPDAVGLLMPVCRPGGHVFGIEAVLVGGNGKQELPPALLTPLLQEGQIPGDLLQVRILQVLTQIIRKRGRVIEPALAAQQHLLVGGMAQRRVQPRPERHHRLPQGEVVGQIVRRLAEHLPAPSGARREDLVGSGPALPENQDPQTGEQTEQQKQRNIHFAYCMLHIRIGRIVDCSRRNQTGFIPRRY